MSRAVRIASGLLALLLAIVVAAAITLSPLPGSTPQTARPFSGFPVPLAVAATDDSNAPVAGLPVTFAIPLGFNVFGQGASVTVNTDANGVAAIPYPGIVGNVDVATAFIEADAPGSLGTVFALTVDGLPAATLSIVSGEGQALARGGSAQPFVVQVIDQNGLVVPYPIVYFDAPSASPSQPSGTFNQTQNAAVIGDANGIAASPPFVANGAVGTGQVSAFALSDSGEVATFFDFSIVPPPLPTLAPVAGSTPQTTRPYCFFPKPVAVMARNSDGTPAAGVTVTFTGQSDGIVFIPDAGSIVTATTGADGIAWASSPSSPSGYIAFGTGTTSVVASSAAAPNTVQFDLTVAGKPPTRIEMLSGDGQLAGLGGTYAPWIVRAFDENSAPVPYAAVQFFVGQPGPGPAATFDGGVTNVEVPADASGVARSSKLTANDVVGGATGSALLEAFPLDDFAPAIIFGFTNVNGNPGYGSLRLWEAPPSSIPVGGTTAIPYAVQVLDTSGNAIANTPVIFTTDSTCATFAGSRTVTATSDANGIATSPLLTGTHASVSCATSARISGQSRDLSTHVFDPSKLVATVSPQFVFVHLDSFYTLYLSFSERGKPVHVTQMDIASLAHGKATYGTTPVVDLDGAAATIDFMPNASPGAYSVLVTAGSQRIVVPVVQLP